MKKKELEIILQGVYPYSRPKANLEQYLTPAEIAADILYIAFQFGDIEDKKVVDLGCGTGIFSTGAIIIGAKEVVGIEIDEDAIELAKKYSKENKLEIDFISEDIENVNLKCDTVLMNPPFGAQKSNVKADRKFIEKAFQISNVIYSIHLSKTIQFIDKMVNSLDGKIDFAKDYSFKIKHIFDFHSKKYIDFDVTLLRILTKK